MIYLKSFNLPKDSWVDFYFSRPYDSRNWPKDLPKANKQYSADERTIHNSYYPWKTFYARGFEHIDFGEITVFYGGNASGKTTLLNVIAQKLGLQRISLFNRSYFFDDYCACNGGYELADDFVSPNAVRGGKIMVSDDVFKNILAVRQRNFEKDIRTEELSREYLRAPRYTNSPSMSRVIKSALDRKEEELSNGETGFQYFIGQIPYDALVLLDEPENSLSAEWQMILAKELYNLSTKGNCQLIIATHSPFILSLPNTRIYDLDSTPVREAKWYELDNMKTYFQLFNAHRQEFEM